jgi:CTP synthase (UTP-ammonia lyase)
MVSIAVVGERDLATAAHQGIEASLAPYREKLGSSFNYRWIGTSAITAASVQDHFRDVTGIWCASGSPYESYSGALLAIQHARTRKKALLGTCGGFQHALMEFAQNVLLFDAMHEELLPAAKAPLIAKLDCSLIGSKGKVITTDPVFSAILGGNDSLEEFNCSYGVNERLVSIFSGSDLVFVAHDDRRQARAFRLANHPFFVGTLFQPERRALAGDLHPIVHAFLGAAQCSTELQRILVNTLS